uniref:Uncharacterized protein n=1 Tax=Trichinella nativa TaxID=6335 RepID=A0A0V1KH80_9BILA
MALGSLSKISSIPLIYLSVTVPVPCSFLSQLLCNTA